MHFEHVRYAESEGIATLTLCRPEKLNALTFESYAELRDGFAWLATRREVRAIVLAGEGRAFCAGGDRHLIIERLFDRPTEALLTFTRLTCDVIRNMRLAPQPIVCSLQGMAAGAGAVLALASDFRVASREARLAFLFNRVGLAGADMGAAFLLPRIVGLGRATELLMLGDAIDAATAERFGLVNQVVEPEALAGAVATLVQRLASGPTFALGLTKRALNEELSLNLLDALEAEARTQALCMTTADFREAFDAMAERRPPRFGNRG